MIKTVHYLCLTDTNKICWFFLNNLKCFSIAFFPSVKCQCKHYFRRLSLKCAVMTSVKSSTALLSHTLKWVSYLSKMDLQPKWSGKLQIHTSLFKQFITNMFILKIICYIYTVYIYNIYKLNSSLDVYTFDNSNI